MRSQERVNPDQPQFFLNLETMKQSTQEMDNLKLNDTLKNSGGKIILNGDSSHQNTAFGSQSGRQIEEASSAMSSEFATGSLAYNSARKSSTSFGLGAFLTVN